jgi:uncharacterized protein YutE (UPF0331/DUF86 family)
MQQEVLELCCNPLSECDDDDGCSSHTPYNVQECCSNCESTYQKCYQHLNENSGDILMPNHVLSSLQLTLNFAIDVGTRFISDISLRNRHEDSFCQKAYELINKQVMFY